MAKKVTVDNLASEMEKILKEYENEVSENMNIITKKIGQKGVQALRNESLSMFPSSGKHKQRYGSTWKATTEKTRLYTRVIIHSSKPGLPHLLEFGHVVSNGTGRALGQAAPHPHVAKVETELVRDFEREVQTKL